MTKNKKIFTFDFENNVSDLAISNNITYVWLWDICDINTLEHITGFKIDDFILTLSKLGCCICYSHNLKYDGSFIIDYLLKNNYVHTMERKLLDKQFRTLITSNGVFYSITVKIKNKTIEFRDSTKKIQGTVEQIAHSFNLPILKGEIDYRKNRDINYIATPEEVDYIHNDTEIIARVLKMQYDKDMTHLTSAGDTFAKYKEVYKYYFDLLFPILPYELDTYIRKSYRGGLVLVNEKFKNKIITENVNCYDVNSMYPFNMVDKILPYGEPIYFKGCYKENVSYPLFIMHIRVDCKLKNDGVKCIMLDNMRFGKLNYLEDTDGKLIDIYITSVDYDLFIDNYDIYDIEYIDGYMFKGSRNIFKKYILPIYELKGKTKGAERQLYKILLNSLYGKFATNPKRQQKIPYLDKDGIVKYINGSISIDDSIYTAVSSFITSYSRAYLVQNIKKHLNNFIYCDTDSIHLLNDFLETELIDDTELGKFKLEKTYVKSKYLGQKCYYGIKENGEKDVKIAGCPKNVAKNISFEEFEIDNTFGGKLIPKRVNGGAVLVETTFTLKNR